MVRKALILHGIINQVFLYSFVLDIKLEYLNQISKHCFLAKA